MLGSDNLLTKKLSEIVDIKQLREQLRRKEQKDHLLFRKSETEY